MRFYIILMFLSFGWMNVQAQGIEFFHGEWKDALVKAKAEDKIIFVDCFTTWCGPCKAMAKNTFTDPKVGEFFNNTFINMKLDMEGKEGKAFGSKFPVSAYPTLYFIDGDGKVVKKVVGGQKPDGLIAIGKDASKGLDKSSAYEEEYLKGNRDYDFMMKFIKAMNNVGKPSLKIANDYLNSSPAITQEQRLKFLFEAATEADSRIFEFMIQNKEEIIGLVGEKAFTDKVNLSCKKTVTKAIEYETESLLTEAIEKAKLALPHGAEAFAYTSQMEYYKAFDKKEEYMKAAEALVKKVSKTEPEYLKFVIEDICKTYSTDQKFNKKASDYAKDLYKNDKSIDNLNIYCKALVGAKDFDKALKVAKEALEHAKKTESPDAAMIEGLVHYITLQKEKAS